MNTSIFYNDLRLTGWTVHYFFPSLWCIILQESLPIQGYQKQKWMTLILIDSQTVKNTCNAGRETKRFLQVNNGIKRQVDTLGSPFITHCTKANDNVGLVEMFSQNIDYFKEKPATMPKTTILLDNGHHRTLHNN